MRHYIRATILSIDRVLPLILDPSYTRAALDGYTVGVNSKRLNTFAYKGTDCTYCGIKGKFFAIETDRKSYTRMPPPEFRSWHLNLWAFDIKGTEVLMTGDHIFARGLGGEDTLENIQTLCTRCNGAKARYEQQLKELLKWQ